MQLNCVCYYNLGLAFYTPTRKIYVNLMSFNKLWFFSSKTPSLPTINLTWNIYKCVILFHWVGCVIEVSSYVIDLLARTRYCYKVVLIFDICDFRSVDRVKKGNLFCLETIVNMVEWGIANLDALRARKRVHEGWFDRTF